MAVDMFRLARQRIVSMSFCWPDFQTVSQLNEIEQ